MKPSRPINVTGNPHWQYVHSTKTDVRKTWARARKALAEKKELDEKTVRILKVRK